MRKLIIKLSAAAMLTAGAVAALQGGAAGAATSVLPGYGGETASSAAALGPSDPILSFTTTMTSYTPVNVAPGGLTAGDGYVLAGKVTRNGAPDGLSTAQCTYTVTTGPVLRVCTVDYALNDGLIVTSGYIDVPGKSAPVTLVIDGGTGAYAGAQGYGTLQPTATGSHVKLRLTG